MKKIFILFVFSIILIAGSLGIYINSLIQDKYIYPSIFIQGVDVSGLTKEQAENVLKDRMDVGEIIFKYKEKSWRYSLKDLGFKFNIKDIVEQAYEIGRNDTIISNWITILKLNHIDEYSLKLSRISNTEKFDDIYLQIKNEIDQNPINATIQIGDSISITPEQEGLNVDIDKLKNLTRNIIESNEPIITIDIPIVVTTPIVKKEQLSFINGVIGEFTTKFDANIYGRSANIKLASSKIDSILLMPGETLSFNNTVGKTTLAAGFKNAPVIVKGELQEGVGGGVCQVSTTLYNSVLYAGLDIIQRRPHSIPSSYVQIGRDAAVAYGALDFIFTNPQDFPVFIRVWVSGNTVTARIYGDTNKKIEKHLSSKVIEQIPRETKYVNDPTLPLGKEVIEELGRDGIKSITYITINGKTQVVSRDHYPAKAKLIKVGIGPPELIENNNTLPGNNITPSNNQNTDEIIIDSIFGGN